MKFMIKPVFLSALLSLGAMHCELAANSQQKNLACRAMEVMRRNKTATAIVALGIGAFITHKALTYGHANQLTLSQAALAQLQETELVAKTEEFVKSLKRGCDDIINTSDRQWLYYKMSIDVGLVHTNKEIADADVAKRLIDYKGVNVGHFKEPINFDYSSEGLEIKATSETFLKRITQLDAEIARTEQFYGRGHANILRAQREYINATQAYAREVIKYLNCCRYRQQEVQNYFQAMTAYTTLAMSISEKAAFYQEQNGALWRYVSDTNNAGGIPPYGPLLLALSQPLRDLISIADRRHELRTKIANLQTTAPYPLWRKIFGPLNNQ